MLLARRLKLVRDIRAVLRENADAKRAPAMQAYMKSKMPFRGVSAPVLRKVVREVVARIAPSCEQRLAAGRTLFFEAKYREERYAALTVTDRRACQSLAVLPLYEEMIVEGGWWDLVDWLASHHVGDILVKEPRVVTPLMKKWARDPHLWKRRAAIICQLRRKDETDLDLLYAVIEPNLADKDFFMRKAIGWALRQYAHTDAREVKRWVTANRERLSALSIREALKNVG